MRALAQVAREAAFAEEPDSGLPVPPPDLAAGGGSEMAGEEESGSSILIERLGAGHGVTAAAAAAAAATETSLAVRHGQNHHEAVAAEASGARSPSGTQSPPPAPPASSPPPEVLELVRYNPDAWVKSVTWLLEQPGNNVHDVLARQQQQPALFQHGTRADDASAAASTFADAVAAGAPGETEAESLQPGGLQQIAPPAIASECSDIPAKAAPLAARGSGAASSDGLVKKWGSRVDTPAALDRIQEVLCGVHLRVPRDQPLPLVVGFYRQRQVAPHERLPLPSLPLLVDRYFDGDYTLFASPWWKRWFAEANLPEPEVPADPPTAAGGKGSSGKEASGAAASSSRWLSAKHRCTTHPAAINRAAESAAAAAAAAAAVAPAGEGGEGSGGGGGGTGGAGGGGRARDRTHGAGAVCYVAKGSADLEYHKKDADPIMAVNLARYLAAAAGDFFQAKPLYAPRQTTLYLAFFADVIGHLELMKVDDEQRRARPGGAKSQTWPANPDGLDDRDIAELRTRLVTLREKDAHLGPALAALRAAASLGATDVF